MNDIKRIIVIGASAGGFNALTELVAAIPEHLPAAIFIVLHMSKASSAEVIQHHLSKHAKYTCTIPHDDEEIKPGHIYLAPPDLHMLVKKDVIRLVKSPHENRWRPSIDALFRSAAVAYDSATIGIILSGMLNDGTSGMLAIKRCGGVCIVQEPVEAEFPDMPESVINNVDVDYRVPVADAGYILADLYTKPVYKNVQIPEDIRIEFEITERMAGTLEEMAKIGNHSNQVCPDCGGGLWQIKNEPVPRFRCHTGHVYTEDILLEKQSEALEESVWVSIRMLEERRNMLINISKRYNGNGPSQLQQEQLQKAEEIKIHIDRLKALLVSINKSAPPKDGYL
jgi:two-component system chemotaxis response regulator CheB